MEKVINGAWSDCDKPTDLAILGPKPISTLPNHATMQRRPLKIARDVFTVEMIMTDDGGSIPVQCQHFVNSLNKAIQSVRVSRQAVCVAECTRFRTTNLQDQLEEISNWQDNDLYRET